MKSYSQLFKEINTQVELKIDVSKTISTQLDIPTNVVRRGIKQGLMTINNKPFHYFEIVVRPNIVVKFQNQLIDLVYTEKSQFDKFVEAVQIELNIKDLSDIPASYKKPFSCYLIAYLSNISYDKIFSSNCLHFDIALLELELFYRDCFKDSKIPRRKELVETLVNQRINSLKELENLINNLINGFFSKSLYKFLQDYTKCFNQPGFQHCIAPILNGSTYSRATIESLIKPIHEAQKISEIDKKFICYKDNEETYEAYLKLMDINSDIDNRIFKKLCVYLLGIFKSECDTLDLKPAKIDVYNTTRKYNFKNNERNFYNLFLFIQNSGEGLAREIKCSSLTQNIEFEDYVVGSLKPGELREISISCKILKIDKPVLSIRTCWLEGSNITNEITSEIVFLEQTEDIPWEELERKKPYTIQEIDERDKLYGRDEILKELQQNILSDKIESYKLWGQKRVGKSSIVKTLRSLFNQTEKILVIWRSIAGLKNTDAIQTLNNLGESLYGEIIEEIDRKIINSYDRDRLRSVEVAEFNGSLLPLENYIKKLRRLDPTLRFVFILDEFDRINEEFFLPGNLGDTFSLNIGKGLSSLNYVGFILVGSENMHLLDRQEINYNSFQGREIDTFDKKNEFQSFKQIITGPVSPFISYTNDSIERVYEETNGNPYFANLICSNIFKICSKLKDNEVDNYTVDTAIQGIVESSQKSHFEHFWGDGITEESNVKKERKADIRRRLLVSYSFSYFQNKEYPKKEQIHKNFKKPIEYNIENYEIDNTISEFLNRKIFFEEIDGTIRIKPSLFEKWLCGPGRTLMIEGVSDLEALQREKQLEAEHKLKNEEINRLSERLIFKTDKIKTREISDYFNQFGGPFEQRRIFKIVDSIFYTSKAEVANFFQREKKSIFRKNELELKDGAKTPYRENVELYSFSRTFKENIEIVDTFKRLSFIRSAKTLKNLHDNKDAWKHSNSNDIIIFESIIDNFSDINNELIGLFDEKLSYEKIPVKLIVLVITTKAKADLIKAMSGFNNFKLIHFKEVEESKIKPFIDTTELFENQDELSYAFAEVRKHFHMTSKDSLNVLFESHCPSKSIPILWNTTSQFKPLFPNLDGSIYTQTKDGNGEANRDRVYHATREFIQTINPFLINYLKIKAESNGVYGEENWFRTDFIPAKIITSITEKWISESCSHPKETYFDLIHYKEVIRHNKELQTTFEIRESKGGGNGLEWFDKINEIRRSPAHQEKPPPSLEDVEYFEKKKDEILRRILLFKNPFLK